MTVELGDVVVNVWDYLSKCSRDINNNYDRELYQGAIRTNDVDWTTRGDIHSRLILCNLTNSMQRTTCRRTLQSVAEKESYRGWDTPS